MSINQPVLYLFLIFTLLDRSVRKQFEAAAAAETAVFGNGFDYQDAIDRDFNYYQENGEPAELEDNEVQREEREDERRMVFPSLQQSHVAFMAPVQRSDDLYAERRELSELEASSEDRQREIDAAVKDTQDTIEHVAGLIKAMREHANALVKDMDDLEKDLLSSCDDNGPSKPGDGGKTDDGGGGGGNASRPEDGSSSNGCGPSNSNSNSSTDKSPTDPCGDTTTTSPGPSPSGNSNSQDPCGKNADRNNGVETTQAPIVMNEWSAAVKNDPGGTQSAKDLMAQAQDAVRSWKAQIEACKRMLDSAVAEAAQNQKLNSFINTKIGSGAGGGQNVVPLQTLRSIGQSLTSQLMMPEMAPAAAASLSPVLEPSHQNATTTAMDAFKTSEGQARMLTGEGRQRKYSGKYDKLRAKGANLWGF